MNVSCFATNVYSLVIHVYSFITNIHSLVMHVHWLIKNVCYLVTNVHWFITNIFSLITHVCWLIENVFCKAKLVLNPCPIFLNMKIFKELKAWRIQSFQLFTVYSQPDSRYLSLSFTKSTKKAQNAQKVFLKTLRAWRD